MSKDQEFIADYQKATRSEPKFSFGAAAAKLIKRLVAALPDVRSLIKKYTQPQ